MKLNNLAMVNSQLPYKQQGAVLLLSLMILLVLTLIGVSSLDGSIMEEKMAANAQTSTSVFQEAESAIKTTFYQESQRPGLAVTRAMNSYEVNLPTSTRRGTGSTTTGGTTTGGTTTGGTTTGGTTTGGTTTGDATTGDATTGDTTTGITRSTRMVFPEERVKAKLFNSSAGTFVARGIEIIGTAEMSGIEESNTQGYSVFPMRP